VEQRLVPVVLPLQEVPPKRPRKRRRKKRRRSPTTTWASVSSTKLLSLVLYINSTRDGYVCGSLATLAGGYQKTNPCFLCRK
jgi:hypothetical protein